MTSTTPETPTDVLASLGATAQRRGLDPLSEHLAAVRRWLGPELAHLERALGDLLAHETGLAQRAAHHLLQRPGKRLRPICVLLSGRLGARPRADEVHAAALACELVHAATLLHDDVLDEGTRRRGAEAARVVFGNAVSVLAGDHLLLRALTLVSGLGIASLLDSLLEVVAAMVSAEALQLARRGTFAPSRDVCLSIIAGKTAALFGWGLAAGAVVSGAPPEHVRALRDAGREIGIAFQMVDDVIDLSGDPARTGKNPFADLLEGKLTWPLVLAAEREPALVARLEAAARGELDAGGLPLLVQHIARTGGLDATRAEAARRAAAAQAHLRTLPTSPARRLLERVVDATVLRMR